MLSEEVGLSARKTALAHAMEFNGAHNDEPGVTVAQIVSTAETFLAFLNPPRGGTVPNQA